MGVSLQCRKFLRAKGLSLLPPLSLFARRAICDGPERAAVHAAAGFILEISDLNFGVNVDSGVNAVNLILISLRTATGVVLYDCQL